GQEQRQDRQQRSQAMVRCVRAHVSLLASRRTTIRRSLGSGVGTGMVDGRAMDFVAAHLLPSLA
ncbi:MAG TPA: hypothetical protein VNL77_00180, partial [Roseiflexaceae bacterium]|nr:hypothetical protein [Roseiflexaceae bacterium]